jgi:Secretion system C-terminal sorting domain
MKNSIAHLLFITAIIVYGSTAGYAQDILWEKSYGGKHADYLMDAQPTADYGFILAGSSLSNKSGNKSDNNLGDLDYWIWKMKENGDLDWQKSFGGFGSDFLQSIALTRDGGFILAGTSASDKGGNKQENSRGNDDFWIIKLDAAGNQDWQKTIGGSGQEKMQSVHQTKDGGYIIGGSSGSEKSGEKTTDNFGNLDYWVLKLDNKGNIQWQKTFGGIYADELHAIEPTTDGGYILGGYSNSPSPMVYKIGIGQKTEDNKGIGDYWVIKLDKDGKEQWQKNIGGDQDDQLSVVHQTYDGNYIIGGNSNSLPNLSKGGTLEGGASDKTSGNADGTDFWILKLNETGNTLWQETYNIAKIDVLTAIVENSDHSLLLSGFAQGEISAKKQLQKKAEPKIIKGTGDYVVIKTTENGQETWRKTVGSNGEDLLKKAVETRDGGYLLTGTSLTPNPSLKDRGAKNSGDRNSVIGSNDFWVVKLKDKTKPDKIKIQIEAVPNPATTYTNIIVGYDFTDGTASVYDLGGRQLQSFAITSRTVPIDLSPYPEGIYLVNIDTNVQHDGVKVIKSLNIKN